MSQNINLHDGEIAVVVGNVSVIMNVNTAFEVIAKVLDGLGGCDGDCTETEEEEDEVQVVNKDFNKPKNDIPDITGLKIDADYLAALSKKSFDPYVKSVSEAKPATSNANGKKEKIPVLVYEFDPNKATRYNDLRAGVGKFVKRFDSMTDAEFYYGVANGTISSVANTWLPYMWHTGAMNPMIGDKKNYKFSSKYNGKNLRWSFTPFYNRGKGINRLVVFRADAVPQFIENRGSK